MTLSEFDIASFKEQLHEMQLAIQEDIMHHPDCPPQVEELLAALERIQSELDKKKSQELLSDFLLVFSFMNAMSEDDDEEFDEDEFEFEDEDEDEDEDDEEER